MEPTDTDVIRPGELMRALTVSKPTLTRWRRRGLIPQPRRIGPHAIGWTRAEIARWLADRPKVA